MKLLKSIDLDLAKKLQSKEYREVFFEDWSNDEVADQIRQLRKLRKMRQVDVARETGMKQPAISRMEQSEHSTWNFVTLLRVAQALDARVRVTFEPAEDVIKTYKGENKRTGAGPSVTALRKAQMEKQEELASQDGSRNLETAQPQIDDAIQPPLPPYLNLRHRLWEQQQ
jgi:transcriptional regulator with XRE-family HTH domain